LLKLGQDGLALALSAEIPLKALAKTSGVVTNTTAGAVTTKVVALAQEYVTARRAFLKGAVRTTGTDVTDTAYVLEGIPWLGVCLRCFVSELLLLHTAATAITVVGAHSTFTCLAVIVVEAFAFTSLAVAYAFHRALNTGVRSRVRSREINPGRGLGACALAAIVLSPSRVVILRALVASAFVVSTTATVARASIWAVSHG